MSKRYSTIIFVPHARAKFRKLRVSHGNLISVFTVIATTLCLSTFFSYQYFTTLSQTHELAKLRRENNDLEKANEEFSRSVETLRTQLHSVEEKTRKLAIIAGVSTLDPGMAGGVGGARGAETPAPSPHRDEVDKMSFDSRRIAADLNLLEKKLVERSRMLSSTPSISPVRGILTDGFGGRRDPFTGERASHSAVDISSDIGQPVRAPADGIVVKAEWASGYGNVIYISHGNGYSTRYGHLSKFNARPGQRVQRGDVVAYVGTTGRSTGPHLHYEVRLNNRPVNPLEYILNAF
ncbi:MAG TPA: peptidoglycan DD-metalloendopeptidase family protein [Thermoanaerobaculia bacterium]|nr:peptidoglycan DD-metalloendopeptidase family protein [Thermoanaerobaculia bacterium]